jgi:hypothetical protein
MFWDMILFSPLKISGVSEEHVFSSVSLEVSANKEINYLLRNTSGLKMVPELVHYRELIILTSIYTTVPSSSFRWQCHTSVNVRKAFGKISSNHFSKALSVLSLLLACNDCSIVCEDYYERLKFIFLIKPISPRLFFIQSLRATFSTDSKFSSFVDVYGRPQSGSSLALTRSL